MFTVPKIKAFLELPNFDKIFKEGLAFLDRGRGAQPVVRFMNIISPLSERFKMLETCLSSVRS